MVKIQVTNAAGSRKSLFLWAKDSAPYPETQGSVGVGVWQERNRIKGTQSGQATWSRKPLYLRETLLTQRHQGGRHQHNKQPALGVSVSLAVRLSYLRAGQVTYPQHAPRSFHHLLPQGLVGSIFFK